VLAGNWLRFSSESGDNSYVVLLQQPVVTAHNIVMVYGMDHRARATSDTSALLHTSVLQAGRDLDAPFGEPLLGRYMSRSESDPTEARVLDALSGDYAPMRFDITVPWNIDSRRYTFAFRHPRCGEQRIVYRYSPPGPLLPIIPGDSPVPILPVAPTPVPPDPHKRLCHLTAISPSHPWSCTPAFAPDVYDQCTSPSGAFLEHIKVQSANNFLAMKLTTEADAGDAEVTRGLLSGIDSSTFPLLPGRNVIEIDTRWDGV
jgi:hypothetical protein